MAQINPVIKKLVNEYAYMPMISINVPEKKLVPSTFIRTFKPNGSPSPIENITVAAIGM
jgi:hypothetical protein